MALGVYRENNPKEHALRKFKMTVRWAAIIAYHQVILMITVLRT